MADLEQERVTALWREAARRLAPAFEAPSRDARCLCGHTTYWHSHRGTGDCEATRDCDCAAFRPVDPERMLKLDALARANRAEAECGRLREQLDAARERGADAETAAAVVRTGDYFEVTTGKGTVTAMHIPIAEWQALRAALGVEGEQENP